MAARADLHQRGQPADRVALGHVHGRGHVQAGPAQVGRPARMAARSGQPGGCAPRGSAARQRHLRRQRLEGVLVRLGDDDVGPGPAELAQLAGGQQVRAGDHQRAVRRDCRRRRPGPWSPCPRRARGRSGCRPARGCRWGWCHPGSGSRARTGTAGAARWPPRPAARRARSRSASATRASARRGRRPARPWPPGPCGVAGVAGGAGGVGAVGVVGVVVLMASARPRRRGPRHRAVRRPRRRDGGRPARPDALV